MANVLYATALTAIWSCVHISPKKNLKINKAIQSSITFYPPSPWLLPLSSRPSSLIFSLDAHHPHHTQCTHSALNAQSLVRTQCRVHSCSSCTQCKVHKSAQKASVHSVLSAFGGPCFKRSAQCTKADQRSGRAKKSSKLEKSG